MLTESVINNIKQSPDWKMLQDHILDKVAELDSIDGIDFTDAHKAAVKGEGRKEARRILEDILQSFLVDPQKVIDKKAVTEGKTGVL